MQSQTLDFERQLHGLEIDMFDPANLLGYGNRASIMRMCLWMALPSPDQQWGVEQLSKTPPH